MVEGLQHAGVFRLKGFELSASGLSASGLWHDVVGTLGTVSADSKDCNTEVAVITRN